MKKIKTRTEPKAKINNQWNRSNNSAPYSVSCPFLALNIQLFECRHFIALVMYQYLLSRSKYNQFTFRRERYLHFHSPPAEFIFNFTGLTSRVDCDGRTFYSLLLPSFWRLPELIKELNRRYRLWTDKIFILFYSTIFLLTAWIRN